MRLFIGIGIPDEVKNVLGDLQSQLKEKGVKGSWRPIIKLHITLEFLGEKSPDIIPVLKTLLTKTATGFPSFQLGIGKLGGFPSLLNPHTLWAGVELETNTLHQLRNALRAELDKAGIAGDGRPFRPHITLVFHPKLKNIDVSEMLPSETGRFIVTELNLYDSKVVNGKRVYEILKSAVLGK